MTDENRQKMPETNSEKMSLVERVVYVKTWSVTYRRIIEFLPDWVTPNAVTAVRTAMIVPIVWTLLTGRFWAALIVFAAAAALDSVDGAIAHVKKMSSTSGAFLDPLADKMLICGVLLAVLSELPVWMRVLTMGICAFAASITLMRIGQLAHAWAENAVTTQTVAAKPIGKLKMIFEVMGIISVIAGLALASPVVIALGGGLLTFGLALAVLSFANQALGWMKS